MADTPISLTLTADDQASPEIAQLTAEIDRLTAELEAQKSALSAGGKDWLDYSQQISSTVESMTNIVSTVEDVLIKTAEIGAAVVVYQKWQLLVTGVKNAYLELKAAMAVGSALIDVGWAEAQLQVARLEVTIGRLGARLLEFGAIGKALSVAGIALGIAQIGISANESNEKTRLLTEQIGGLTTALQQLDPASKPVLIAKERFEALTKASLALGVGAEELLPQYKAFFDQTASGSLSVQKSADTLTDLAKTYVALHASSAETAAAQAQLTAAFAAGFTTVDQLGTVFGSALNPALDAVAKQMGLTREQLRQLIDSGRLGSEDVIPALAAAANNLTQPLQSAGDAAEFSKRQFEAMGLSFYDLSAKTLPGIDSALQHTAKEIADTADATVDPIGAAVEQIVNFGARVEDWARRVKLAITEAFTTSDWAAAWKTGLQEALYGLDYILVGLREELSATGQSIGVLAGSAVTATNPIEALSEVWKGMQDQLLNTRDRLNEYVNALEGVDNAQGRTTEGVNTATEALKRLKDVPLPEALQDIIGKLNSTHTASQAVSAVWKEISSLDLTGNNLKSLMTLVKAIDEVSAATENAVGTQKAFSNQLSNLPTDSLIALMAKVQQLAPLLEASGNKGVLMGTVLGAVFDKIGLEADAAGGKLTQYGRDGAAALTAIATTAASTGAQIRSALAAVLDSAKTKEDVDAISTEFKRLGDNGTLSLQLVADGQAMISKRFVEMQTQIPGIKDGLKALGVESAQSLRLLADSAQASFVQIKTGGATLDQLRVGFLAWADAEAKAAAANDALVPATVLNTAKQLGLADALDALIAKHHAVNLATESTIDGIKRHSKQTDDLVSAQQREITSKTALIRAEIDLARANGDTAEVRRLQIDLAQKEVDLAQLSATRKQIEANAAAQVYLALQKESGNRLALGQTISDEEKLRISTAKTAMETAAIEAQAAGLIEEAEKKKAAAIAIGNLSINSATDAVEKNTEAVQQNSSAISEQSKVESDSAGITGTLANSLKEYRGQMEALSPAAKTYYDLQLGISTAQYGIAGSAEAARSAALGLEASLEGVSSKAAEYKANADEAAQAANRISSEMIFATNKLGIYIDSMALAQAKTREVFFEQKASLEGVLDSIKKMGDEGSSAFSNIDAAMLGLTRQSEMARQNFSLLDDADLSRLQSQIDETKHKLQQMQDEAKSAKDRIAELNAEIASEKGDQATSDRLKLQIEQNQALADVEAKLSAAQQEHNRDLIALYEQQKQKLQELYGLKERNLEKDVQSRDTTKGTTDSTVAGLNRVTAAAGTAQAAMGGLAKTDLSALYGQLNGLHQAANDLRSVL